MLELLKPFFGVILQWAGIVGGVLLVLFKARQSGKEVIERKEAMETLKGVQTRNETQNKLNTLNDASLDKLYQDHIKRK